MTPQKDEAVGARDANGSRIYQNERRDFASDFEGGKAFSVMQAKAERAGCTLLELADGSFLLGGNACGRAVPCLRAVGDMLRRVGGRP